MTVITGPGFRLTETSMLDLIMIVLAVGFLVLSQAYAVACDAL